MEKLKNLVNKLGTIVKYIAIASAFFKAVEFFHEEIKNIDLGDSKPVDDKKIETDGN